MGILGIKSGVGAAKIAFPVDSPMIKLSFFIFPLQIPMTAVLIPGKRKHLLTFVCLGMTLACVWASQETLLKMQLLVCEVGKVGCRPRYSNKLPGDAQSAGL